MSAVEQAAALLRSEKHTVLGQEGRKILWTCLNGHDRNQSVSDVLRGHRCPKCARKGRTPRLPVAIPIGTVVGDLVCVEYLGVVDGLSRVRARNQTNGRELVLTTGEFKTKKRLLLTAAEHKRRAAEGTRKTKGVPNPTNAKHTFGDLKTVCSEVGFELLNPVDDSVMVFDTRSTGNWLFKCFCGQEFSPQINNVLQGTTTSCGCTKSKPQSELLGYVRELCSDAVPNNRTEIAPFELDIWIPSKKIAIEFSGLYWHSEKLLGRAARTQHLHKLQKCEALGVRLITVFEDEWKFKRPQVQAFLGAVLGRKTHSVGARKCDVIWDSKTTLAKEWHLQGRGRGIAVALKYGDMIVAEAVFSRPDASRSKTGVAGVYELNRFVIAPNWNVPGALGRLLGSFWEHTPDATKLVSYSDNRWSQGNVYRATGFALAKENPPSFWWFHKSNPVKKYHRFTYRASKVRALFPVHPGPTAWDTMADNGWNRVWDCGTKRWELLK